MNICSSKTWKVATKNIKKEINPIVPNTDKEFKVKAFT